MTGYIRPTKLAESTWAAAPAPAPAAAAAVTAAPPAPTSDHLVVTLRRRVQNSMQPSPGGNSKDNEVDAAVHMHMEATYTRTCGWVCIKRLCGPEQRSHDTERSKGAEVRTSDVHVTELAAVHATEGERLPACNHARVGTRRTKGGQTVMSREQHPSPSNRPTPTWGTSRAHAHHRGGGGHAMGGGRVDDIQAHATTSAAG
jgi:hypothetical protein